MDLKDFEIMAPVGSRESLAAAIQAGADSMISPEINSNNQMLFRDNNKAAINGKHVVLLLATTTTGETIRRALECIQYYGGEIEWVASLFGTINSVDGVEVETLFDENDVTGYAAYPVWVLSALPAGTKD